LFGEFAMGKVSSQRNNQIMRNDLKSPQILPIIIYTLYSEIFHGKLYTLYQGTERVLEFCLKLALIVFFFEMGWVLDLLHQDYQT
jgi:hypothetical protein